MSTKHEGFTPGPWTVEHDTNVMGVRLSVGLRASVAACGGFCTNTDGGLYVDESAANARLIADAPRLYAENRRLRDAIGSVAYSLEQDGRTADGCTKADAAARLRDALTGDDA